jgi:iron(III) transport system ATP-binding protein
VVRNLTKIYRTARRGDVKALDNVSIEVGSGEFVVLLGPSGCGKTTLLRCVAGLEKPDEGDIQVQGKTAFNSERDVWLPPEGRNLSMVFQSYALWPHMSVFDNIAYPLRNQKVPKAQVNERVNGVLKTVGLEAQGVAYPGQLSGGQQQRVALARAIVGGDGLVLFDEPLSNLDAKVRDRLRIELLALQKEIGFSALYVTHDQGEATVLADRVAVMDVGRVAQIGSADEIYHRPNSRYVADFIGQANEISGTVTGFEGDFCRVQTPLGSLTGTAVDPTALTEGKTVTVMFRPEQVRVGDAATATNRFTGTVRRAIFLGANIEHLVDVSNTMITIHGTGTDRHAEGAELSLSIPSNAVRIFEA